ERIANAGYDFGLIDATRMYVEGLLAAAADERLAGLPLRDFHAEPLARGWVTYFEPYEAVHKMNVEKVRSTQQKAAD
ncbi:MAG: MBL fold metallo-hydrolase, partial [Hyphomicrobium sp.]|nr:MBL fold metallo-hydrolase [Hyphomicrobium sp.]